MCGVIVGARVVVGWRNGSIARVLELCAACEGDLWRGGAALSSQPLYQRDKYYRRMDRIHADPVALAALRAKNRAKANACNARKRALRDRVEKKIADAWQPSKRALQSRQWHADRKAQGLSTPGSAGRRVNARPLGGGVPFPLPSPG